MPSFRVHFAAGFWLLVHEHTVAAALQAVEPLRDYDPVNFRPTRVVEQQSDGTWLCVLKGPQLEKALGL